MDPDRQERQDRQDRHWAAQGFKEGVMKDKREEKKVEKKVYEKPELKRQGNLKDVGIFDQASVD